MTTQHATVSNLPTSFDSYILKGWSLVPIPAGTKGPRHKGWNLKENALRLGTHVPVGHGVGLAHAYSGTMALDIDDWGTAAGLLSKRGLDLQALYDAPDAVTIVSGRQGHGKLLYAMPFGAALPSRKINGPNGTAYELRCATTNGLTVQDVLPPSIHPDTQQPYQWGGKGRWESLPTIPDALLALWMELNAIPERKATLQSADNASWDEIRNALYAITPDCSRDDWINLGMALHAAGTNTDELDTALNLWDTWSSQSTTKYKGQGDIAACWRSFTPHVSGVTLGTLFHIAAQHGHKRPDPDVSHLFSGAPVTAPQRIVDDLQNPLPVVDMSLFPEVLRRRVLEEANNVDCDPLSPLFAGLGAVCAAADARSRLELSEGFSVPPLIWSMTIGESSEKKTAGAKGMFEPLGAIEREYNIADAKALLRWEAMNAAFQSSRKAYLQQASTTDFILGGSNTDDLPPVAPDPGPEPSSVRFVVRDITSQKLVRVVETRQRGVLCHLDEMSGWISAVTDPRSGENRSAWTQAIECATYSVDRVGEPKPIIVDNFAVAICGNIQPEVFKSAIVAMGSDGMLQRFLPGILKLTSGKIPEPIPEMFTNKPQYAAMLKRIYLTPTTNYRLCDIGRAEFHNFRQWHKDNKTQERIGGKNSIFMGAYGKLEGLTGRLALLMHLMDNPENPIVSIVHLRNAIAFTTTYVLDALRYSLNELLGTSEREFDVWMLDHLVVLSDTDKTVTLSDIKRSARRRIEGMKPHDADDLIRSAMGLMVSKGYAVMIVDTFKTTEWAINPDLAVSFREYRIDVIKARQAANDHRRAIVLRAGKSTPRIIARGYDPLTMGG